MLRAIILSLAFLAAISFATKRAIQRASCMASGSAKDRVCFACLWLCDVLVAATFILALTLAF
jgi:hypothetical protein